MEYEPHIDSLFRITSKFIDKNDVRTILEIGASDGVETVALSQKYPKADIYSFECNPATIPIWLQNCAKDARIVPVQKAVTDVEGELSFFPTDPEKTVTAWADGNPGASSLLKASGKYEVEKYVQNEIKVKATTLEIFLKEKNIEKVDLIWMDIQGAELSALKGAGSRLKDIRIIHTEVEFFPIYEKQPLYGDIKKFMNANGFLLGYFTNFGPYAGDAIFFNKRFLEKNKVFSLSTRDKVLYPIYKIIRALRSAIGKALRFLKN